MAFDVVRHNVQWDMRIEHIATDRTGLFLMSLTHMSFVVENRRHAQRTDVRVVDTVEKKARVIISEGTGRERANSRTDSKSAKVARISK